ncbi:alpha-galactosidase [Salinispirillum sp. LH 10-3-1]|uniref:Alpha-galactosidase n=1 Tax=Salinispirillum sp. LH 10-3-1 TaxID=2952525 RepID=A0AB38YG80_9GAMM
MPSVHLNNGFISAVLTGDEQTGLSWGFLGPALEVDNDLAATEAALRSAVPQAFLDPRINTPLLPTGSEGVLSRPALSVSDGHHWLPHLRLVRVESISSTQCRIVQRAEQPALEVITVFTLDPQRPVLTLQHWLTNLGAVPLEVRALEAAIPVAAELQEMLHFTGRWCQEFRPQRQRVQFNNYSWENRKGRTSHDHFPGLLLGTPGFSESQGDVMAMHLAWSGNHQQHLIVDTFQPTRYQAGIGFMPHECMLAPGDTHESAVLYVAFSDTGLNGIRRAFHGHVRAHIVHFPDPSKPRPVHLNTWEAVYFNHDTADLQDLADAAQKMGVERFILDDGWFKGRRNDRAGLGDWTVDQSMYPEGLGPLAQHVVAAGMEFGIWFEPEMVNPDSDLYRAHPEWALQLPNRDQALGRYQMVLDLTRPEVQDYLFSHIDAVLRDVPVRYIKWDMNRELVQAGDADGAAVYHRQVLGVYGLLARVRAAHPQVEIESCASGGGRIDFAILQHTQRFWASDCNDPVERQMIQWGFGLFLPPEVMGAHIGPAHSHTTSRDTTLLYRALTAMFGHFGVEADVRLLSEQERTEMAALIAWHQQQRPWWHAGQLQVWDYPDPELRATGMVSADQQKVSIVVAQQGMPQRAVPVPLKVTGLPPNVAYRITVPFSPTVTNHRMKTLPSWCEETIVLTGRQLARHGLALPVLDPASACLIELSATEE